MIAKKWLPVLIWMALIFLVSDQPRAAIPAFDRFDLVVKKGGHILAYAILAFLLRRNGLSLPTAVAIAAIYAVSDEYHQTFVPGRTGRALDVVIDGVGITLGVLAHHFRARRRAPQ
jgi:VanZ family protein